MAKQIDPGHDELRDTLRVVGPVVLGLTNLRIGQFQARGRSISWVAK
jgi:hypothetical protein